MMTVIKWSIVIKLPVKRAPWFSVYNWQVASCEYKQYYDVVLRREKGSQSDENVKKCNHDKVNYANSKRRAFEVGIM